MKFLLRRPVGSMYREEVTAGRPSISARLSPIPYDRSGLMKRTVLTSRGYEALRVELPCRHEVEALGLRRKSVRQELPEAPRSETWRSRAQGTGIKPRNVRRGLSRRRSSI